MHIHSGGWVYFRHDKFKVVVDEDIRHNDVLHSVAQHCAQMELSSLSEGIEVHIIGSGGAAFELVVNHNVCMADYNYDVASENLKDAGSLNEVSVQTLLRRRRLYWNFVSQHATHIACPRSAIIEGIDSLRSYYWDSQNRGSYSTTPFSRAECEELLKLLGELKEDAKEDNMPSTTALVAWILREIYSFRKGDVYGKFTYAQMDRYRRSIAQPSYIELEPASFVSTVLDMIIIGPFFGIPKTYLSQIQGASEFRGRLSNLHAKWRSYSQQLTTEYSDFILVSTVMLSATVGFLSVGDILQIARVFSTIAAFTSLGSMIAGVFFMWRHQRHTQLSSTHDAFAYIHNARSNILGLRGHAILLSLPAVLLVWSIVTFSVAIMAFALQTVTGGSQYDSASTWTIVGVFTLIAACVLVGVYVFSKMWTRRADSSLTNILKRLR
ncbi:hypothetical protein WOLCODRAFT_131819 [Wolfiporia cocos MD-104 SS10]|uniref:Uncharacterized protein n=1 Tax=Wolfiporia cocos (strain MD-104) TaxID=742152 RepID=A0A2H3JTX9_WOLCO|nr:hypothetical protein WOLCODRAFT_131819 [Wolfiporia cocos MD-104 SS10]